MGKKENEVTVFDTDTWWFTCW